MLTDVSVPSEVPIRGLFSKDLWTSPPRSHETLLNRSRGDRTAGRTLESEGINQCVFPLGQWRSIVVDPSAVPKERSGTTRAALEPRAAYLHDRSCRAG
nr:hypothetical protein CFP56_74975 [Quercus suber]